MLVCYNNDLCLYWPYSQIMALKSYRNPCWFFLVYSTLLGLYWPYSDTFCIHSICAFSRLFFSNVSYSVILYQWWNFLRVCNQSNMFKFTGVGLVFSPLYSYTRGFNDIIMYLSNIRVGWFPKIVESNSFIYRCEGYSFPTLKQTQKKSFKVLNSFRHNYLWFIEA